ncbi:LacI family transcriptional regulator [Actinoplanes ianthinogenes]|uniref:LacI family transcriptional regulator n=1 Tax=Actinoplanes ianthinogenes TaxID=122358 RepID=A0ABM7LKQ5_9ACTN|nr:LacI family DNA-binding transcriptional regulator [Actinoplanes ianthinogenes]BCJ39841.1 LacI family transcriptional regulator [Actinoplanes ianthinogenes]GGR08516.1 LacI family transcriptional regulator [Actinoplanes ianthinogenes]
MAVTIKDVARLAGVSPSSVCRALTDPARVRADTRERVESAAEQLGYRPNRAARSLITGRTANLGVVLPDLANPFFPTVVKAIQKQARRFDYAVFLSDTDEDPAVEVPAIRALAMQVDGFLLCSPRASDHELRSNARDKPVVVLNRRITPFPSVTADNADGMRQAVGHLAALGHRAVAYVGGPRTSWSHRDRQRGLRAATAARGMRLVEVGNVAPTVDGGAAAADLVLAAPVTAVLAYNDLVALGLLQRFQARGVRVPEHLSVIGFDDIPVAGLLGPPLTTVAIDTEQIGRVGVDLLLELMAGPVHRGVTRRVLPTQLIVRGSTGPTV